MNNRYRSNQRKICCICECKVVFPVQFLVDELNRVGKNREDLTELQQRWNQAVALELAFFDIGYEL